MQHNTKNALICNNKQEVRTDIYIYIYIYIYISKINKNFVYFTSLFALLVWY